MTLRRPEPSVTARDDVLWDLLTSIGVVLLWVAALRTYLVPFALIIGIAALALRGRSVLRPATPTVEGARALAASLVAAGLTEPEARAFARAWDDALFGATTVTTIPPAGNPATASLAMPAAPVGDALLYVLPAPDADALATLRFDPPPRAVRRAIVAWIDVALGRPVQQAP